MPLPQKGGDRFPITFSLFAGSKCYKGRITPWCKIPDSFIFPKWQPPPKRLKIRHLRPDKLMVGYLFFWKQNHEIPTRNFFKLMVAICFAPKCGEMFHRFWLCTSYLFKRVETTKPWFWFRIGKSFQEKCPTELDVSFYFLVPTWAMVVVMLVDASGGVDNKTTEESKLDKAEGGVGWKQGNAESFDLLNWKSRKPFAEGKGHRINWVVVSNIFYFHPYLGRWWNFCYAWNRQLDQGSWNEQVKKLRWSPNMPKV